jgi:hypothetical protein
MPVQKLPNEMPTGAHGRKARFRLIAVVVYGQVIGVLSHDFHMLRAVIYS